MQRQIRYCLYSEVQIFRILCPVPKRLGIALNAF